MTDQSNNGESDAEVRARLVDPRYDSRSMKFDPVFAAETDRMSQQLWGGAAAPPGAASAAALHGGANPNGADLRARLVDPRYDSRSMKFDPGFAAETDRMSQQLWGGAAAPGSASAAPHGRANPSVADLRARLVDPRNDPNKREFNREFADETDRLSRQIHPDRNAVTSSRPSPRAQNAANPVPADVMAYTLGNSEKLAPHMKTLEGDELYNDARKLARDAGLTPSQFSAFLSPLLEKLVEKGGETSVDFQTEWPKLVPAEARGLDQSAQRVAAGRRIEAALDFVEKDAVQAGLDPKIAAYVVEQLGESELGIRAIEWINRLVVVARTPKRLGM